MRTSSRPFLLLSTVGFALLLAACGEKSSDSPAPTPAATPPAGTPPAGTAPAGTAPSDPGGAGGISHASLIGTIEKLGPSIYMQGTHKLMDGQTMVALLESDKVDLSAHEGVRVRVEGTIRDTVEGNQRIIEVDRVVAP